MPATTPSSPDAARPSSAWNVIRLRSRWKPTKERLVQEGTHEAIRIRIHRACSWLQRGEALEADGATDHADDALILRWVAFNSLYGRWDEETKHPEPDFDSVRDFVSRLLPLDHDDRLNTLVHGAASRGGALNRDSVHACNEMLGQLVPRFLLVLIDHGWGEDWGELCYPPIR